MAEPLIERPGLTVRRRAPESQWLLHCAPGDAAGLGLPAAMLTSAPAGAAQVLHLAPDEWLLIGPAEGAPPPVPAVAHALVDVSERTLGVTIAGARAGDLLAAGCPVDLARFPVGACSRTLFGKVTVTLWRTGDLAFRLDYARSFDGYVTRLLALAAEDAG